MEVHDESVGEKVLNQITSAVTGVPASIQASLTKALKRLCLAVIEWPSAVFEGKAAEIRAISGARAELTKKIGADLAGSAPIDQRAAVAAAEIHTKNILGRQFNVDSVVHEAVSSIVNDAEEGASEGAPSEGAARSDPNKVVADDWLDFFEREAELASTDDLRLAFGKILAGECTRPGSFSKSTLRVLSQLSQDTANHFQVFCNLANFACPPGGALPDVRVWNLGREVGGNELSEFGITYAMLLDLMEAGLVTADIESHVMYGPLQHQAEVGLYGVMEYGRRRFGLVPLPNGPKTVQEVGDTYFHGPSLTKVGRELSKVVTIQENPAYTQALRTYLNKIGIARAHVRWLDSEQKYVRELESAHS